MTLKPVKSSARFRRSFSVVGSFLILGITACGPSSGNDDSDGSTTVFTDGGASDSGAVPRPDGGTSDASDVLTPDGGTSDASDVLTPDGGTSDASATDASVLGTVCDCTCEEAVEFGTACTAQGGFYDYCNNVRCSYTPQYNTICHPPPPPPEADEFQCTFLNCTVGQICLFDQPLGDGCSRHSCEAPPAPCANTVTCACLRNNNVIHAGTTCEEDAAGHVTVSGYNASW